MIRKTCLTLAAAALTMVAAPRQARAICGGSAFATCATVGIVKARLPNGHIQLIVALANLSGLRGKTAAAAFTSFGLWGLPSAARYVAGSLYFIGPNSSSWQFGSNGLTGAGIQNTVFGIQTRGNGIGSLSGAIFGFRLRNVSLSQINTQNWAIYAQAGPNCSSALVSTGGNANAGPYNPACSPSVTPEPASVILLATGLVGLGGLGWRRRRR